MIKLDVSLHELEAILDVAPDGIYELELVKFRTNAEGEFIHRYESARGGVMKVLRPVFRIVAPDTPHDGKFVEHSIFLPRSRELAKFHKAFPEAITADGLDENLVIGRRCHAYVTSDSYGNKVKTILLPEEWNARRESEKVEQESLTEESK